MRKSPPRWLPPLLILSVTLNIGLISTFTYLVLSENNLPHAHEDIQPSPATMPPPTNISLLKELSKASVHHLLSMLNDQELVEEGYAKRDLALATLVTFYHFNIEGALGKAPEQKRSFIFTHPENGKDYTVTLFPNLSDFHFQAILHYAKTEKWPFTPYGLFCLIQRMQPFPDPSLLEAFALTSEFRAVSTLFSKSGMQIGTNPLIQMITEGEWEQVATFVTQQKLLPDLTPNRRRCFILDYLKHDSRIAARILIEADSEFSAKRLSDEQILAVFDLYPEPSPYLESFAEVLLSSPRSDAVWKKAAEKLGKEILAKHQSSTSTETADPTYTVEPGDSLWKIARKCNTTIEALLEVNDLPGEMIHPGQTLKLPD